MRFPFRGLLSTGDDIEGPRFLFRVPLWMLSSSPWSSLSEMLMLFNGRVSVRWSEGATCTYCGEGVRGGGVHFGGFTCCVNSVI